MVSAALVLGGLLLILSPRNALSIGQLAVATMAASGALFVVVRQLKPAVWMTPFNPRDRPASSSSDRSEIDRLQTRLAGDRVKVGPGLSLPPEVVRVLQPIVRSELEAARGAPGHARPSPALQAILRFESPDARPRERGRRGDERAVAEVVHQILDELDALQASPDSSSERPFA